MTTDADKKNSGQFGVLLRRWRHIRGMSQLSLAHLANTSPRHISFLETGRARPGRDVVMELAHVLRLSLRDVNALMYAAGLPRPYPEDRLAASRDMTPFRALINNLVHGNSKHPCCVVDRYWRIQDANHSLRILFRELGWIFDIPDDKDVVDRIFTQADNASKLLNIDQVARQFVLRLRSEFSFEGDDDAIDSLAKKVEKLFAFASDPAALDEDEFPIDIICRYQVGPEIYSAVVGIGRFGGTAHIELSELRLVWFIPADVASEELLARIVAKSGLVPAHEAQYAPLQPVDHDD